MENVLDVVGEEILERIQNNEFERDVEGFIPVSGETPSQSFELLRDYWLQRDGLFEDPEFPVESIQLYFTGEPVAVRWRRPGELAEHPQFINQGPIAGDVRQGSIGNCWALAAASVLAQYGPLFYRVVPPDQGFGHNYAGIFHFHFWRYGRWTEVIIDDRLPCRNDNGQLLYSRPPTENVFWAILLEKAYAKMYGGYAVLSGGKVSDSLSDLTGGITEEWDLKSLDVAKRRDMELNHAYAIMKARELIVDNRQIIVMLIRNPWGWANWQGQHSLDWERLPQGHARYMRQKLADNSGGFWISLDDFIRFFSRLHICYLGPHAISEVSAMTKREIEKIFDGVMFDGKWTKNGTADGNLRNGPTKTIDEKPCEKKNCLFSIRIGCNEWKES